MADDHARHEFKLVRATALRRRAGPAEQEEILNMMAAEGWELVDARRSDIWDWRSEDILTLRRDR